MARLPIAVCSSRGSNSTPWVPLRHHPIANPAAPATTTVAVATTCPFTVSSLMASQSLVPKMAKGFSSLVALGCCAQHQGRPSTFLRLGAPLFLSLEALPWNVHKRKEACSLKTPPSSSTGWQLFVSLIFLGGNGWRFLAAGPPVCWSLFKAAAGSRVGSEEQQHVCCGPSSHSKLSGTAAG